VAELLETLLYLANDLPQPICFTESPRGSNLYLCRVGGWSQHCPQKIQTNKTLTAPDGKHHSLRKAVQPRTAFTEPNTTQPLQTQFHQPLNPRIALPCDMPGFQTIIFLQSSCPECLQTNWSALQLLLRAQLHANRWSFRRRRTPDLPMLPGGHGETSLTHQLPHKQRYFHLSPPRQARVRPVTSSHTERHTHTPLTCYQACKGCCAG